MAHTFDLRSLSEEDWEIYKQARKKVIEEIEALLDNPLVTKDTRDCVRVVINHININHDRA